MLSSLRAVVLGEFDPIDCADLRLVAHARKLASTVIAVPHDNGTAALPWEVRAALISACAPDVVVERHRASNSNDLLVVWADRTFDTELAGRRLEVVGPRPTCDVTTSDWWRRLVSGCGNPIRALVHLGQRVPAPAFDVLMSYWSELNRATDDPLT